MAKKILLIDDDEKLIALLAKYLSQFDLEILSALRPSEGLRVLQEQKPSLVVLDLMLPEQNGFEVCKEIRKRGNTPVIMLTARGDVADRVVGLELGADDYMPKPFEPRELLARIQSVLRRSESPAPASKEVLSLSGLELDPNKREAKLDGRVLDLTTMEYDILYFFATHAGVALSRDQIMDHLRGIDWEAYNRSIDVLISRLRQKLRDDPKRPRFFKTVWGTGYQFIG
ncbi:response regulator transcription factor [bacterium]|nr:response regulator transcription factor [bacterium]